MGKASLSLQELKQFPTLQKLLEATCEEEQTSWGMCINCDGNISFGKESVGWEMIITLEEILHDSILRLGENFDPEDVILFYGVEYPPCGKINISFIMLSAYKNGIKRFPYIAWKNA
jgi:hypothetical protein